MKEQGDIIRGWVRKARSDEVAFEASLKAGAFDAACFHAQQAVEKYLKAFLFQRGKEFPFTHNLAKLVEICAVTEPSFGTLMDIVAPLTPYAVELRYDADFWPTHEVAEEAGLAVSKVRDFVVSLLPEELTET